jgi:hypothetical protein
MTVRVLVREEGRGKGEEKRVGERERWGGRDVERESREEGGERAGMGGSSMVMDVRREDHQ